MRAPLTLPVGLDDRELLALVNRNLRSRNESIVLTGLLGCHLLGEKAVPLVPSVIRLLGKRRFKHDIHSTAIAVLDGLNCRDPRIIPRLGRVIRRYLRYWVEGRDSMDCAVGAIRYLGKFVGEKRAASLLARCLRNDEYQIRIPAIEALARLGETARPELKALWRFMREEYGETETGLRRCTDAFRCLGVALSLIVRLGEHTDEVSDILNALREREHVGSRAMGLGVELALNLPIGPGIYDVWRINSQVEPSRTPGGSIDLSSENRTQRWLFDLVSEGVFLANDRLAEESIEELSFLFRSAREVEVKALTARLLGACGVEEAVPALCEAAMGELELLRLAAVDALGLIGSGAAASGPILTQLLSSGEVVMRRAVIKAMSGIGEEVCRLAISEITLAAMDEDKLLRSEACVLLRELGIDVMTDMDDWSSGDEAPGMEFLLRRVG